MISKGMTELRRRLYEEAGMPETLGTVLFRLRVEIYNHFYESYKQHIGNKV